MKRKMTGIAAAYIFGSFFASFFTGLPELLILAAAAAGVAFIGLRKGLTLRDLSLMSLSFAAAFSAFTLKQTLEYEKLTVYAGQTGTFSGEVTDIRRYGENSAYTLKGTINDDVTAKITYYGTDLSAEYGDVVTLGECRFELPSSDYLFDGVTYYKSAGVYLEAKSAKGVSLERTGTHRLRNAVADYRERMISRFRIEMGTDCGDFLAGMLFGQKQGLSDNVRTSLYRVGIGHVLAVSGLHVTVIAALAMLLMRRLRVNRFAAFGLMNVLLILLITAANYPVSAIRATLMLEFAYSARLFRRQGDSFNSLAWAVLLICISDPFVIYSSGFLLSAAGTFGIAVFAPYMTKDIPADAPLRRFVKAFLIMLCTTLTITPLCMRYFDESSLIAPLMNVLLVPLCSLSMVIGLIYVLTGGLLPVLPLAQLPIELVLRISDSVSRLSFTHFSCGSHTFMVTAFACSAMTVLVCIVFRSRKLTALAAAMSVAALMLGSGIHSLRSFDTFTVASLGRGSNCAAVVEYQGNTLVFDLTGNYKTPDYVRKYLSRSGVERVTLLSVDRNSDSVRSAYAQELSAFDIAQTAVGSESDIAIGGSRVYCCGGTFTAELGGTKVAFLPAGTEDIPDAELLVFYGDLPKDAQPVTGRGVLCLDGSGSNFEITLGSSGCEIRRL